MRLYGHIVSFNFMTYFRYPLELIAAALKPLLEFGMVILFWSIVAVSSAGAVDFRHIIAYFLVATAVSNLVFISGLKFGSSLAKAIKSGDISQYLVRPLPVVRFYHASLIGGMGVTYLVSLIFLVLGFVIMPPASWLAVGLFLVSLPLAVAISYSINVLVGTVAFYFVEASSIKNVMNHIIGVFSGAMVPLTFFPGTLKTVTLALPFQAVVFGPTQALRATTLNSQTLVSLLIAAGWAVVLGLWAAWAWRKGLRNYEAVGM